MAAQVSGNIVSEQSGHIIAAKKRRKIYGRHPGEDIAHIYTPSNLLHPGRPHVLHFTTSENTVFYGSIKESTH